MKKTLITLFIILSLPATQGCSFSDALPFWKSPTNQRAKECGESSQPTDRDIDNILDFSKGAFEAPGWERNYTVMPTRVAVTYLHNQIDAVAYFENLLYSCGEAYEQIDEYLTRDSFTISFKDYDSYKETNSCQFSNTRLHQFNATYQEMPYQIRYWAEPQSNTRAYIAMLVFPADSQHMNEYAKRLFPNLTECK